MRYLLYSDVHWSLYSSIVRKNGDKYSVRLENLIKSMDWAEGLAIENKCDEVISLGDFFDTPTLSAQEVSALQEVKFARDIPHKFLVGNHESNVLDLQYSTTRVFESMGFDVISKPMITEVNDQVDFIFIPYRTNGDMMKFTEYLPKNNKKKVVFAHQDLAGLQYGRFLSSSGFDINEIKDNCSLFLNGHLHNGTSFDNIVLVGNLTGANFNEDATRFEHLAFILEIDGDKITLESIANPYAMNFYKIKIEDNDDLQQLTNLKTNSVISVVCNNKLLKKAEALIETNPNILEHRTTIFYTGSSFSSEDKENFVVEDHLKQFIEYAQTKLESSEMLNEELSRLGGN